MDNQFCVLLYSKYSVYSKQIIDKLSSCSEDLYSLYRINLLCIDNEDVRERIVKSKSVTINVIPTLLIIYQDGSIEKYEGVTIFNWVENLISKHSPPPPPPPPQPPVHEYIDYDDDDEVQEEEYIPPPQNTKQRQQSVVSRSKPRQQQVQKRLVGGKGNGNGNNGKKGSGNSGRGGSRDGGGGRNNNTSVSDILDGDSDENTEVDNDDNYNNISKPKAVIQTGNGNYDLVDDLSDFENEKSSSSSKAKTAAEKKSHDLMAAAMEMQKSREILDEQRRPPGVRV